MNGNPMVSIIVPVYNVEKYIRKCVDSILRQTYKNLDIILVDDGSLDSSGKICDEYAYTDDRVNVIHQSNLGLSAARNAGLELAKGEYIVFVDSDDYISYECIETCIVNMTNEVELLMFNYALVDENNNIIEKMYSKKRELMTEKMFWNNYFSGNVVVCVIACCKMYRRTLFKDVRFRNGRLHEDEFILHHIIRQCNNIVFIDQPLYYYLQRNGSITTSRNTKSFWDSVAAYYERAIYFKEKGDYLFEEYTYNKIIDMCLSLEDEYEIKAHKELLDKIRKEVFRFSNGKNISIKKKVKMRLFVFSPFILKKISKGIYK